MDDTQEQTTVSAPKKSSARPDLATILGIALAMLGIIGGLLLEKGSINDIAQGTAALIVLGGTFGAVLVNTPMNVVLGALKRLKHVFFDPAEPPQAMIEELIRYATKARKNGLVSLEAEADEITDPFLRKALTLAVDGADLQEIRKMLELDMIMCDQRSDAEAKVFESAGGYAPTIGIIGAVMGLIQVMKHLENIEEVGHGIAVAFVATVYGVAIANIFLLPAANKIKSRNQQELQMRDLIIEGVAGIVEGMNPKLIRSKLEAYAPPLTAKAAKAEAAKTAAETQPA